jgi:hypothetical protein
MMLFKRLTCILLSVAAAMTLSLGAASADVDKLNVLGSDRAFPRVWRAYPDMDASFERPGIDRSLSKVRSIAIGDSQEKLVRAIGQPVSAYEDGSWNFNIALPWPQRHRLVCQYRVYFDADKRVKGTIWRRPQCVNLVTGKSE